MDVKTCVACNEEKSLDDFYNDSTRRDGKYPNCRTCAAAAKKRSREKNPVPIETRREYVRRYKEKNPESFRKQWRNQQLKKYRLTSDEYDQLLANQEGCCAICRSEPGNRMLAVDHCHETNRVRGLLCSNCNTALGLLKDDLDLIYAAITYLQIS